MLKKIEKFDSDIFYTICQYNIFKMKLPLHGIRNTTCMQVTILFYYFINK